MTQLEGVARALGLNPPQHSVPRAEPPANAAGMVSAVLRAETQATAASLHNLRFPPFPSAAGTAPGAGASTLIPAAAGTLQASGAGTAGLVAFAAAAGTAPHTYTERVAALGPAGYWRLGDASGTVAVAAAGSDGAYQGTPEHIPLPLVDDSSGGCTGFAADRWLSLTTPIGNGTFTLDCALQLDAHKSKHMIATTGGGSTSGQFSLELIDDGVGGLQARVWSTSPAGEVVIFRTPAGSIPVGDAFKFSYRRGLDGTQTVLIDGVEQTLTQEGNAALPASWDAPPAGTVHIGRWSSGADPLDGVMAELAVWNRAVSTGDLLTLARPKSIVWLPAAHDAGSVSAGSSSDLDLAALAHPATGITVAPAAPTPGLGSVTINGTVATYTAGALEGDDAFGVRITRGGLTSGTCLVTIDVVAASALRWDLPHAGQWYGSTEWNVSMGDTKLTETSESGVSTFFRAAKSGTMSHFRLQKRVNDVDKTGYSDGDGGKYTVKIVPADPVTRLPILGATPISRIDNWLPPGGAVPGSTDWPTVEFTTKGQVVAGEPYCIVFVNTHSDPVGNHFSMNNLNNYMAVNDTDVANVPAGGWDPIEIGGALYHPLPITARNRTIRNRRIGLANIQVRLSDGTWMGPRGIAPLHDQPTNGGDPIINITSTQQIRDRWKITGASRLVTDVYVRCFRKNNQNVSLVIALESGPASDTAGNGTLVEGITIPAAQIKDVGADFQRHEPGATPVHYVKGTFTTPRTLTLGQLYNLRLRASGGTLYLHGVKGCEHGNVLWSPTPRFHRDWSQFAAERTLPLDSNIDSMGAQLSADSGSSWSWNIGGYSDPQEFPIIFKCTPL